MISDYVHTRSNSIQIEFKLFIDQLRIYITFKVQNSYATTIYLDVLKKKKKEEFDVRNFHSKIEMLSRAIVLEVRGENEIYSNTNARAQRLTDKRLRGKIGPARCIGR